ncbi:MAG: hypothetical protein KHX30_09555 [Clostridium sp.]|nr:hypothetical protein [Clostridium sp.]
MRTRDRGWAARGISKERQKTLYNEAANPDNRDTLIKAAQAVNEQLSPYIVESLAGFNEAIGRPKIGYYALYSKNNDMVCERNDFYGYRKKTLVVIDKMLRLRSTL